jgi:hypothetical protein
MLKLTLAAATGLAVTALGAGALVSAPTASALPRRCEALTAKSVAYHNAGTIMEAYGYYSLASFYYGQAQAYGDLAIDCFRGL